MTVKSVMMDYIQILDIYRYIFVFIRGRVYLLIRTGSYQYPAQ